MTSIMHHAAASQCARVPVAEVRLSIWNLVLKSEFSERMCRDEMRRDDLE